MCLFDIFDLMITQTTIRGGGGGGGRGKGGGGRRL